MKTLTQYAVSPESTYRGRPIAILPKVFCGLRGKPMLLAVVFFVYGPALAGEDWDFALKQKNECSVGTQLEMNLCLEKERKKVELRLAEENRILQRALQQPQDAVRAQQAWVKFKEQECRFATSGLEAGQSQYQFALHACSIDLTEKRIRDLQAHISANCNGCPPRKTTQTK